MSGLQLQLLLLLLSPTLLSACCKATCDMHLMRLQSLLFASYEVLNCDANAAGALSAMSVVLGMTKQNQIPCRARRTHGVPDRCPLFMDGTIVQTF